MLSYPARYSSTTQKFFPVFKDAATVGGGGKRLEVSSYRSKPTSLQSLDPRHKQKKKEHPVIAKKKRGKKSRIKHNNLMTKVTSSIVPVSGVTC